MAWYRAAYRASREQYFRFTRRGFEVGSRHRVIVMGAGDAGMQLVKAMVSDPTGSWLPVALLDDEPSRRHRRVRGVRVVGTRDDVATLAEFTQRRTS